MSPANDNTAAAPASGPIKNLRITFWGVQGSCPMFPEAREVEDYNQRVRLDAVSRTIDDIRRRSNGGLINLEKVLGGPITPAAVLAYQQQLGSLSLPVFGGDTTCISVETSDGNTIMLDGGSGIRNGSKNLIQSWGDRPRQVYIFGSHEHLDHRSGLPFCQFCFARPPFALHVYGTRQFLSALDSRYGVFSHQISNQMHFDDPIDYRFMAATFHGTELRSFDDNDQPNAEDTDPPWKIHDMRQPILIGKTRITAFDVYHGATRCLAYKIEHNEASFLFCTDHELRHGSDPNEARQRKSVAAEARLCQQSMGVDLAYYDAQYFLEEYLGRQRIGSTAAVSRLDWGHGCVEDVIERAKRCGVKKSYLGHHDPERGWPERLDLDQKLIDGSTAECRVELAKSELVEDL